MELIDEEGNLFGVVNVVDVLVILVVLTVVVVGAALAGPFPPGDEGDEQLSEETRYVTLDLGEHPVLVAERISEGSVLASAESGGNLTVTDVYAGPTSSGNVSLTVRAEVEDLVAGGEDDVFEFDGQPVDEDERLTLDGTDHELQGTVVSVEEEGETLDVDRTEVAVRSTVPADTANRLEAGETSTLAGHEVATLETVEVYSTADPAEKHIVAGLTLQTLDDGETPVFGDTPVTEGSTIDFEAVTYSFSSTVVEPTSHDPPGERTNVSAVVKLEHVPPEITDAVQVGMEDRPGSVTTARVLDKQTEPATVVQVDEEGVLREYEHPRNEDIYLTVELLTYDTTACIQYGTECLRIGDDVTIDFRTIVVDGTVIEIEDDDT